MLTLTPPLPDNAKCSCVVHVAPTPFFANRGCHIRILNEVEGLKKQGKRVILCTYGLGLDIDDVEIRRIWRIPGYTKTDAGFSPYRFLADFLLFFLVLKTIITEKPDIIHGHLHEGGLIGSVASRILFWRKTPVIMDVQGSLSGELASYGHFKRAPFVLKIFLQVEKLICRLPDFIVCSSPAGMECTVEVCGASADKVVLFGDVVPDEFFVERDKKSAKTEVGIPDEKTIVMYTGSLLPGKGVDVLMAAIKTFLADDVSTIFALIGYPVEEIKHHIRDHGIGDRVMVVGEVSYLELSGWLAAADVAVDPKRAGAGEASGKILHYMACGLPVVCFKTANNIDLLGETAFMARDESADELCRSIQLALTDSKTRNMYGAAGKEKAWERFSLEAAGKKLAALYDQLVR